MRPTVLNTLFADIKNIPGLGPKLSGLVQKLCGVHPVDVLFHLPAGMVYRPQVQGFRELIPRQTATIRITVTGHAKPPRRSMPYRVMGEGDGFLIELLFFNYHGDYLDKNLPVGETRFVSGKVEISSGVVKMLHPDYITATSDKIPVYEPIYPLTGGLPGKVLQKAVQFVLSRAPQLPEWLDEAFLKREKWPSWTAAIHAAHAPKTPTDFAPTHPARERLAYDELLANQLALMLTRMHHKKQKGLSLTGDRVRYNQILNALPYQLTGAQERVLQEIGDDLSGPDKMVRLLQGDVGSGKTIVSLLSLVMAADSGFQGVLMAPTDILARQHAETFFKLCETAGVRVALLTAREKGKKREAILAGLAAGEIDILIGTHAVLVEDVAFKNLGLVVIDEQHKFGVHQRLSLTQKQRGINLLVMTATPIPRTLALTTYGDMDLSVLDEKPANRKPIETRVLSVNKIPELMHKIKQLTTGEGAQVYWVCPLVEESEKSDLMAAEKRFEELKSVLGDRVGLVHGKMKGPEKDAVMSRFITHEIDVLVATTVIEVGVDVKNATVMVIEHAERFGLAGLHQLRGRIGRGDKASKCLLLHGFPLSDTAKERLQVMRDSDDGFVIAEADLRLRGAGELLGARQSGLQEFKIADLSMHHHLLLTATDDAKMILSLDPGLKTSRGEALRTLLYLFKKDAEVSTLKAG